MNGKCKLSINEEMRALIVQMNPNLMKQMNDTLRYSVNSNESPELLFVIAETFWKLDKMWETVRQLF